MKKNLQFLLLFCISGSPFHPKVTDARKVRVVGGWQTLLDANNRMQLALNEQKRIVFDVKDAGPGRFHCHISPVKSFTLNKYHYITEGWEKLSPSRISI